MLVEMFIESLMIDLLSKQPVVFLRECEGNRYLRIWIDPFNYYMIDSGMRKKPFIRPLTHDLMKSVLDQLDVTVKSVAITKLEMDTFYANIILSRGEGKTWVIDSRPSDALALAIRTSGPIYVEASILEQVGVVDSPKSTGATKGATGRAIEPRGVEDQALSEDTQKFIDFIDRVSPSDFDYNED